MQACLYAGDSVSKRTLRLAIPNGSLQDLTVDLFCRAGYSMAVQQRSYFPTVDDEEIECLLVRPQEQPRYIEAGLIDAGVTGLDWILETGTDVVEVIDMVYSKLSRRPTRWVLAVPDESPVKDVRDLQGKRIATELVRVVREYLARAG